jgi:lipoprotein-anchoring transpeptidase ErfK/SrfK
MSMLLRTRTLLTGLAGTVALTTVLAGCGALPGSQPGGSAPSEAPVAADDTSTTAESATPTPTTPPVRLDANVEDEATKVKVSTLVEVEASAGTVSKVKLTYTGVDSKGQKVKGSVDGELKKDGSRWKAKERLEPSATYTLAATGRNSADETTTTTTTFKTQKLTLAEQTFPTVYPLPDSKVGVGMPVVVTFDVPVKDKAEVEKNLHVTSKPAQTGTWNWLSATEVRYRPKKYWQPGTQVTVKADVNGVNAGGGVFGQTSASTNFSIGRSLITRVDLASDVATVYRDGKKVRTIYVSGGKTGWQTRSGTKLIMAKEFNKKMTNEMIGAEEDYTLVAKYALRITNSGEFLHSAPWNAANFGVRNASHGCVGMSIADSAWLYENTLIGDPVVTTGSSRGLEQGNGYSDWDVSYATYSKGSAL